MQQRPPITKWITSRLPERNELREVFNVVLFLVFGWSIRGFLFKMPALTLYFGLKNNLAVLCYMLAFALVETLIVTSVLVLISMLLPARVLRRGFAYKGFLTILVASVALILFQGYSQVNFLKDMLADNYSSVPPLVMGVVGAAAVLVVLLWIFQRWPRFQKYLLTLVEQFGVFTYIYVPLGLIGLMVVIIRNLP
ncbi:MAG: hypothetical protein ACXWNQ_04225 [Anaerolineales bacterium]